MFYFHRFSIDSTDNKANDIIFIISNAQGHVYPMSNAFMGICMAHVESSYCNPMEVIVT